MQLYTHCDGESCGKTAGDQYILGLRRQGFKPLATLSGGKSSEDDSNPPGNFCYYDLLA
jgi:hypothetical protein